MKGQQEKSDKTQNSVSVVLPQEQKSIDIWANKQIEGNATILGIFLMQCVEYTKSAVAFALRPGNLSPR